MGNGDANEKTAVTTAENSESRGRCDSATDEIFSYRDEIIVRKLAILEPRGEGRDQSVVRRPRQVLRQMPECQVDHVAVVRMLFARGLRQVEPKAMDQLDIVFREDTQDFGYLQRDRDSELIELAPEPSWKPAAYRR